MVVCVGLNPIRNVCRQVYAAEKPFFAQYKKNNTCEQVYAAEKPRVYPVVTLKRMANHIWEHHVTISFAL